MQLIGGKTMAEEAARELDAIKTALEALWPLDDEGRRRAVTGIAGALGVPVSSRSPSQVPGSRGMDAANGGELGTPKQFLAAKAPETDIERVTVHAYYLTHGREIPHFATKDISDLNTEAAGPRFSNVSYAASNATKKGGYLAAAPGGKKQITARGEALVEALPDRSAVAAALDAMPGRPRRAASRKKTNDKEA